jgi:hypothetical protein
MFNIILTTFNFAINLDAYLFQDEAVYPGPDAQQNHSYRSKAETDAQEQHTSLHVSQRGYFQLSKTRWHRGFSLNYTWGGGF